MLLTAWLLAFSRFPRGTRVHTCVRAAHAGPACRSPLLLTGFEPGDHTHGVQGRLQEPPASPPARHRETDLSPLRRFAGRADPPADGLETSARSLGFGTRGGSAVVARRQGHGTAHAAEPRQGPPNARGHTYSRTCPLLGGYLGSFWSSLQIWGAADTFEGTKEETAGIPSPHTEASSNSEPRCSRVQVHSAHTLTTGQLMERKC